ncbi:hypothetical protein [Rhizobium sp. MHM7A]|uniref:hypothetical protein n=1 Tax=Rhizobium sp. MHM7A TaxID=2583233 RepID=UPI001105CFC6|nr:hypothetical protein [Rhizobium sp. MHM7A]TLX16020.1 hypothetical protein FFR93_01495 [Rhizobium sp. MHM7A]
MTLSPDSYVLRCRDYGRPSFETVERMCNLSANIAANLPASFNDERKPIFSHRLLMELQRAWSSMPFALNELNNPANWNIDALLTEKLTWDGEVKALRQPKIVIDVEITKPGNLSVRWFRTDEDIREDAFERRDFERPPNELLFVRGFKDAFYDIDRKGDTWRNKFASAVLGTCIGAVEDVIHLAGANFKIERNWKVDLKYVDDLVVGFEETNNQTRERRRLAPILEEKQRFESEVGMTCEAIVGISRAYERNGLSTARIGAILRDHFSLDFASFSRFSATRKNAERLLGEVNSQPEEVQLTDEQANLSPINPVRESLSVRQALNSRIASATSARDQNNTPKAIPTYPKREHPASDEELAAIGVSSVSELVQRVNDHLLSSNDFPISVGDFPSNKRLFDRLVARYERLGLNQQKPNDVIQPKVG